MESSAAPAKKTPVVLIVVIVLAVLCICGIVAGLVLGGTIFGTAFALTGPAAGQGDAFMQALKDGNYTAAYALCSDSLQQELGSAEDLGTAIESGQVRPKSWKFTSRNVDNGVARLEGSFVAGREGNLVLELDKVGKDWKVNFFNLEYP